MPPYVLDTDILSLFREGHPAVERRVLAQPPGAVATTAVTVDEHLTGWYALVRRARRPDLIELAYTTLVEAVLFFGRLPILNYGQADIARFEGLVRLKRNVGKNDLRIAAIALGCGAVVVTRNVRDFARIPGLAVEDWSLPPPGPAAARS